MFFKNCPIMPHRPHKQSNGSTTNTKEKHENVQKHGNEKKRDETWIDLGNTNNPNNKNQGDKKK